MTPEEFVDAYRGHECHLMQFKKDLDDLIAFYEQEAFDAGIGEVYERFKAEILGRKREFKTLKDYKEVTK